MVVKYDKLRYILQYIVTVSSNLIRQYNQNCRLYTNT
jgi:hypothetical protein